MLDRAPLPTPHTHPVLVSKVCFAFVTYPTSIHHHNSSLSHYHLFLPRWLLNRSPCFHPWHAPDPCSSHVSLRKHEPEHAIHLLKTLWWHPLPLHKVRTPWQGLRGPIWAACHRPPPCSLRSFVQPCWPSCWSSNAQVHFHLEPLPDMLFHQVLSRLLPSL